MSMRPEAVVVDTSIVVKWFFAESHQPQSLLLREALQRGQTKLYAPDLIYAEFANTVWKRVLFYGLDAEEGAQIVTLFKGIPLAIVPMADLLEKAYWLGTQHRRTVYDSLFLALALETQSRLVTGDEKFYHAVHSAFPNVVWIGNWV